MNQETSANDLLNTDENIRPELPSGLKVLTVLTFIGCALQLVGAVWNFMNAEKSYKDVDKIVAQMKSDDVPAIAKSMMGDPEHFVQLITKSYENRIPLIAMGLLAAGLCFFGALQMRKLKKQGFIFYSIGELLPFVSQFLFIGAFSFSGIFFYIAAGISLLFILLYAIQRKHLTK